jgi:uncharacterized protein (TIGR02646 family)
MRAIAKRQFGGFHLEQANANPPQTHNDAISRWKIFSHKKSLLSMLLDEQYQLCCYSELRADKEGLSYHIEHVENKSQNPSRTFDYSNLAASTLDSENDLPAFKAQSYEVFGGHASGKRQGFDMSRFISPHQPDCSRYFAYLSDGRVVPSAGLTQHERDCAQYTIDLLNLNSPYLLVKRGDWWDELDGLYQEHTAKDWSLEELAAIDLVPTGNALSRFFTLTRQFFGPVAEQTLQNHAPQLV